MLNGIHPILTGLLLSHLDAMGHSDAVVVADAHFPGARLAHRYIELPGIGTPEVLGAIRSVIPLDDAPGLDLMESADGTVLPVQNQLMRAAGATDADTQFVERHAFYDLSAGAFLIVRTGEARSYGNAILRKGVVAPYESGAER